MKRAQWLSIIEGFTEPCEEWPFVLLPQSGLRRNTAVFRAVRKPRPAKSQGNVEATICVHIRRGSSHERDGICGEYLDVSSEEHLVVIQKYPMKGPIADGRGDTYMSESEVANYIPWEEIIFIEFKVERKSPT